MDMDEDDDFYAPEESEVVPKPEEHEGPVADKEVKAQDEEDLEEGEEEDEEEDEDSDIDIITERKDGTKAAPPSQARYNDIRNIPQRTGSSDAIVKQAPVKKEAPSKPRVSGADLPAVATSKIDVNAKPIYDPAGKAITQVNIDEDLGENDKPWRRPGTDTSDYFNYGFDEFTWALYAAKQDGLRAEYDQDKVAQNQKKMMEDMNMMMAMGGMPGMPGMPGAAAGGGMPGMEGIPPEMQAMMQQMMASGIDPSQMDPSQMFGAVAAGAAGQNNQGQAFGAGQNFGQNQGYGYDQQQQQQQQQHQGGARGNFRGKGRGRNW